MLGQRSGSTGDEEVADPTAVSSKDLVNAAVQEFVARLAGMADQRLVESVMELVQPVRIPSGEAVLELGEPSDSVYFIVTGRLVVQSADGGVPIRRLGRGEIVGEMGVLAGAPRNATVRADRDTILGRLTKEAFESLGASYPGFGLGVARVVAERLSPTMRTTDKLHTVAIATANPRLADTGLAEQLLAVMSKRGDVAHVTCGEMTRVLSGGDPGRTVQEWGRAADVLDVIEAESDWVLLEDDASAPGWSSVALQHGDRALILMTSSPDAREEERARALVDAAGPHTRRGKWLVVVWPPGTTRPHSSADFMERFDVTRILHMREGSTADLSRIARLATGTGFGFVLGGGGARGFASLGVYRAMEELGMPVDAVAGASVGGILGAVIADGRSAAEVLEEAREGFDRVLDYTIPFVSLIRGKRIAREIETRFGGADVRDLVRPFLCTSTNLTRATRVIHDSGSLTKATRAGLAIPGVIPPIPHEGELLVDGGVLDNLPIGPLRDTGLVDTVTAVDVSPPAGPKARHDYGLSVSGWEALTGKLRKRRYPGVVAVLLRSMIVGSMAERDRLVSGGYADLYLDLDLRGISLLSFKNVNEVAEAGYQAALPRIEAFLTARDLNPA